MPTSVSNVNLPAGIPALEDSEKLIMKLEAELRHARQQHIGQRITIEQLSELLSNTNGSLHDYRQRYDNEYGN
jgi:hypothetical protein